MVTKVFVSVRAIALCHNVTPTYEEGEVDADETEVDQDQEAKVVYQASSPDEVSRQTKPILTRHLKPNKLWYLNYIKEWAILNNAIAHDRKPSFYWSIHHHKPGAFFAN